MADQEDCLKESNLSVKSPKRRMLNMSEKLELIKLIDEAPKSKRKIAAMFGIPSTTACTIYTNREKIIRLSKSSYTNMNLKRLRASSYPEVEEQVLAWYIKNYAEKADNQVSCLALRAKALQIAKALGYNNFSASNGWIERFKARHNLKFRKNRNKNAPSDSQKTPNKNTSVDLSKSDIFHCGNSNETEISNDIKPNVVWENVSNPVMELTEGQEEYKDPHTFGYETHNSPLQNGIGKSQTVNRLPSHIIPEIHLVETDSSNQNSLYKGFNNISFYKKGHSNLRIQEVDDAFSVILNYVRSLGGNVSEKTHEALKELKDFIAREKDKKIQSKITDYFSFV